MRSTRVPLFEMDGGIPGHSGGKRDPCASSAFRENGSNPRLREMTPSNENNIFHGIDPESLLLSKPHTIINIPDYPLLEIASSDSILLLCWKGKI